MFNTLPKTAQEFMTWKWAQIAPYFQDLAGRNITAENVDVWLADWTHLNDLIREANSRLYVATTLDTTDEAGKQRFQDFMVEVIEPSDPAAQTLKQKLLESGLQPNGFEIPLRNMRSEAALFREANVPLFTQEQILGMEYQGIIGAQTVELDGEERTIAQLRPIYQDPDREVREDAWRLGAERQLQDRGALNGLWSRFLTLRRQQANNAGYDNYRDFRWEQFKRFDYTPDDCVTFHNAIEQVVVPAAVRIYEKRRKQLRYDSLRPWDLDVDPLGRKPLKPFTHVTDLIDRAVTIFKRVEPDFGDYFATMRDEGLLDLENHKGKAPGGYQDYFAFVKRPFIFMNAVGLHDDVQTLLHEGGHAFHSFESSRLPYAQQLDISAEIAEVASMSMELLGAPYLSEDQGGYYSRQDAARARIEHLEGMILFWPYMAVVDAFQHWVYNNHAAANNAANCDAKWAELWGRFMKGVDWSGLEDSMVTGWHRKLHIFEIPFYYVDYGLAQMGAAQVWRNSLHDLKGAVDQYRHMLSLGGTRPLPQLYEVAGAKLAFDAATLGELVTLIEGTIEELEQAE
jgi:oligoendopeptidase F